MGFQFNLLSADYFTAYTNQVKLNWKEARQMLQAKEGYSVEDFEHYILTSSLFSAKIEGNTLDFNSFFRNRNDKKSPVKKEVEEIENLVSGYKNAIANPLNEAEFLKSHGLLSKTLVKPAERGKYRKVPVGIYDSGSGRLAYMAVEPEFVGVEMAKLFEDIKILLAAELTDNEVFYYASMLHLWVAMIHPFADGNGRAARLLEKWFLATKLGTPAWAILSEKYYWGHRPEYYKNIALGYNYYALKWERCLPFLLMLTGAVVSGE